MIENLANIEAMLVGMFLILLLVSFAFLLIIIYLSNRDKRNMKPVLRAVSDESVIEELYIKIKNNSKMYAENIVMMTEDQKSSALVESVNNIGMIVLKNYGNSPAIDIEIQKMAYCKPSDGMENKLFSLQCGEYRALLLSIPSDLVNHLGINKISFSCRNILNSRFNTQFSYTVSKALSKKLDEKSTLYVIVQV
ncbi:MAG: hypothetical protein JXQ23_12660 [Clostridia bacterium]|nr:hypothetical protein [Clostridia bacterium]